MRNSIIYIFVLCLLCLVSSCVEKEFFEPAQKVEKDTPVVFTATPKGFTKATVGTRAGEEEEDDGKFNATRFENTIYNAYFLLFDHNNLLRIKGKATINEEGAVSYNVGRDVLSIFQTFRICFLANVPESVFNDLTVNTTTWSNLETYYFDVSYAPFSETACLGVPQKADLNGDGKEEYAMPMFESKVVSAPYNSADDYYSIQLERMFAKVEISMALGIQDDGNLFTSEPQFSLLDCEILNIPKKVPIVEKTGATHYSSDTGESNYDTGEISSYTDFEYIIYSSSQSSPSYKSLFFYVPEHKLGLLPSPDTPATQKPTLLEGKNLRPVFAKITGFLTDRAGKTYDATYSIYLGQTNNDNFDLSRNTKYLNYVRLNGVSDPEVDHRVVIEEISEMVDNLVDQKGQTANCYIIEGNGTYMLPAYRGAYKLPDINAEMCDRGTNTVLICDNPDITITIDPRLSKQSTIVFTVTGITTGNTDVSPNTGNAVIARIKDNGEIDWSWHLWFVGNNSFSLGDVDLGDWTSNIVKSQTLPDNTTSMMDRNLGTHSTVWTANPGVDLGLYYQYGRKEPYIGGSPVGGGTLEGNTSWNRTDNKKSPTDPCPPGYRVPSQSVWEGTNNQNATKTNFSGNLDRWYIGIIYSNPQNVTTFRYWNNRTTLSSNDDIYYPYGYISGNTIENTASGSSTGELQSNYKYETRISRDVDMGWSETVTTEVYSEYTNVKYSYDYEAHVGALLNSSSASPFIAYSSVNNIRLTSYSYQERTEVTTQTWLNPTGSKKTSYSTPITVYNTQVSAIVDDVEDSLPGGIFGTDCDSNIIQYNANNIYQLRCVKE